MLYLEGQTFPQDVKRAAELFRQASVAGNPEAQYALDEQRHLPDYLPTLLRLLTKLDDRELREDLIAECMLPALGKMKTALKSKENLYAPLVEAVETRLIAEAPARAVGLLARELNVLPRAAELSFIG